MVAMNIVELCSKVGENALGVTLVSTRCNQESTSRSLSQESGPTF